MLAQSEGERALIEAENARSETLVRMKLEQYRLDKLPEIVSEMMKPAEKIESIRIHQITGFGGAPGTTSAGTDGGGSKPPVNQVMDSILGMALQLAGAEKHRRLDRLGLLIRRSRDRSNPEPETLPKRKTK